MFLPLPHNLKRFIYQKAMTYILRKKQIRVLGLRIKYLKKLIIGQLNINCLRNKFDLLTYQSKDFIDILMITERKLHESFPIG